jgi:lysine 2,3-aminomutase
LRSNKNKHSHTLRKTRELIDADLISDDAAENIEQVAQHFSVAITSTMQQQIKEPSLDDPVAKQFVPSTQELTITPEELHDPISDEAYTPVKGITHRYPDRCLLKPVNVCPVYCRFCFRREKIGPGSETLSAEELEVAFNYIEQHPTLWEVILSGGDPLILKPKQLADILARLDRIEHVSVVRIHTRIPIVDPGRINQQMLNALKLKNKPTYLVVHINHPNEFSVEAQQACARLVDNGIPLLSQSVLLKSINDNQDTLAQLMRLLIKNRIKPYYLHHADMAKGTSHFRTSIEEGKQLMQSLRGHVSGICQPTYVLDIPGGYGKVPIGPTYINESTPLKDGTKTYQVEDYQYNIHTYTSKN